MIIPEDVVFLKQDIYNEYKHCVTTTSINVIPIHVGEHVGKCNVFSKQERMIGILTVSNPNVMNIGRPEYLNGTAYYFFKVDYNGEILIIPIAPFTQNKALCGYTLDEEYYNKFLKVKK